MKKYLNISLTAVVIFFISCTSAQTQSNCEKLDASDFQSQMVDLPEANIIDVRTPGEYEQGHIEGAVNMDINSSDFTQQVEKLDKNKPVMVYCLSGGRSADASKRLKQMGFSTIYELKGGMMSWRAAGLPETKATSAQSAGMTSEDYDLLIESETMVLVDFYADWCAPCQKMKPYLEEIAADSNYQVKVVRIDVDANKELCKELGIAGLPVLKLYRNKELVWENQGYIEKEDVVKEF